MGGCPGSHGLPPAMLTSGLRPLWTRGCPRAVNWSRPIFFPSRSRLRLRRSERRRGEGDAVSAAARAEGPAAAGDPGASQGLGPAGFPQAPAALRPRGRSKLTTVFTPAPHDRGRSSSV